MFSPHAPSPFSPQITEAARALVDRSAVLNFNIAPKGNMTVISAMVLDRNLYRVALSIKSHRSQETIYAECSCTQARPCVHIAALFFFTASQIPNSPETWPSRPAENFGAATRADAHTAREADAMIRTLSSTTIDQERIVRSNLATLTVPQMRTIARRRNWPLKGTSKSGIVDQIVVQMLRAIADGTFFDGLSPKQATFLGALHLAWDLDSGVKEGELNYTWRELLRERGDWRETVTALCEYGALFQDPANSLYGSLFLVANTLPASALAEWLPTPMPAQRFKNSRLVKQSMMLSEQMDWLLRAPEGLTLRLGPSLASLRRTERLGWPVPPREEQRPIESTRSVVTFPLPDYWLDDESADALGPGLATREVADWLVEVALQSGLLGEENGVLCTGNVAVYDGLTPAKRRLILFGLWQVTSLSPYELRCVLRERPTLRLWRNAIATGPYGLFQQDIVQARRLIARCLLALHHVQPAGEDGWFDLAAFLRLCQTLTPDLYRRFSGGALWGLAYQHQKNPRSEEPPVWSDAYRHLVVALVEGPLFWTGVVDLLKQGRETVALRLTPLGRWIAAPDRPAELPLTAAAEATRPPSTCTWSDDLTLTAQPGSDWQTVLPALNSLMERIPDRPRGYRFSPTRLEGQFRLGVTAEHLIARAAAAGLSLPPAAVDYLTDLYASFGRVHLYEALTVIGFSDDYALAELRAAKLIRPEQIIHEFSPRLIAVPDAEVEGIVRLLRSRNHTPQVVGA